MAPTKGSPDQLLHPLQLRFSKAARRASISWQTTKHIHALGFLSWDVILATQFLWESYPYQEMQAWSGTTVVSKKPPEQAGTLYIFLVDVSWDPRDSTRPFFTACLKLLLLGWLGGGPFSMKAPKLVLEFC